MDENNKKGGEENDTWKWEEKETYNQEKDKTPREDNSNKRITKIRISNLGHLNWS